MAELRAIPGNWELDDETPGPKSSRPRYVPKRGEEKEHVNLKVPTRLVRQIDEYVASRVDPYCKTRSDAINDAILAWLMSLKTTTSGAPSIMALDLEVAYSGYEQDHFEQILNQLESEIDKASKDKNPKRLQALLKSAKQSRPTFANKCGQVKIDLLDKLIARLDEILS